MTDISAHATATVATPADQVWAVMKRFDDLSWTNGAVAELEADGEGVGMTRRVRTKGSDQWITERMVACDDSAMTFSYVIDDGEAIPNVANYRATASVTPSDAGSVITWETAGSSPDEHAEASSQILDMMSAGMVQLFAAQFQPAEPA